jgi:hypothetical protein
MPSTVLTGKGCVVDVSDGVVFGGVQDFKLTCELEEISFPAGESWSSYSVPMGVKWRGEVAFKALDAAALRLALGGTASAGRVLEVLGEYAAVPAEAPHTVTLEHDDAVAGSERVADTTGEAFARVDDSPAAGEYSIDGLVLTFNAADAGTALSLDYLRLDDSDGDKLTVGPRDLPGRFALYGVLRGHDLQSGEVPAGRFAVYLADCRRSGSFDLGAANGKLGAFTLRFTAHNSSDGDIVFYLPPSRGSL